MYRALLISLPIFGLAMVASPPSAPAEATASHRVESSTSVESIAEHLRRLDRQLQDRLRTLERQVTHDAAELELELFDRHLRNMETRIRGLGSDAAAHLLSRARSIGLKLRAVERAAAKGGPLKSRASARRAEAVVRQPLEGGVPANDDCSDAPLIGNGTFVGTTVGAGNDGSSDCGGADAPDVWFRYSSPVGGTIFADTFGSDFDTVLSVHSGSCPATRDTELTCNDNALGLQSAVNFNIAPGEEVLIRLSGFAGDSGQFALNVGTGGAVSGRVTDAATGEPLSSVEVRFFATQGYYDPSVVTDPEGNYTVTGLPGGAYFAVAGFSTHFIVELYEDLPCPEGDCDLESGVPIEVTLGSVTEGIDFSLDLGGSLTGTVRDSASGAPLPDSEVQLYDFAGQRIDDAYTDAVGRYTFGGLVAGEYFVRALSSEFLDEVYDDVPCSGHGCDPTIGSSIQVRLGETTAGIDFALDRLGSISGLVTDAATGEPLPFVDINVEEEASSFDAFGSTDESGRYTVAGLPPGSYLVRTHNRSAYRDELYDDVPCPDCSVSLATPVRVELSSTTTNIDFALDKLGAISGMVTDAATGVPQPFFRVRAASGGGSFHASVWTDATGRFLLEGLHPESYFVYTFERSDLQDELYDDIPCPFGDCDTTAGTPVPVSLETTTPGIDFALERLGSISGRVTDDATGAPIAGFRVVAQAADGLNGDSTSTDEQGRYLLDRLVPGTYFVRTDEFDDYQDELYDDIPCSPRDCDASIGAPVTVSFATTTPGIDFALRRLGSIAGTVTEAAGGAPIAGVYVEVENLETSSSWFGETDADGSYLVDDLPAGSYVVLTRHTGEFRDELYDDIPCIFDSCDRTAGVAVAVSLETTTAGIDFALERLGSIAGSVTAAATGAPIGSAYVDVLDSTGSHVRSGQVDAAGRYTVVGLEPGTYFARGHGEQQFLPQLYQGIPCAFHECDVTSGTPIVVELNATTGAIDFALELAGSIAGTVRPPNRERLDGRLSIWDANGGFLTSAYIDSEGRYLVSGLAAGTHFVSTAGIQSYDPFTRYNDELYDDLPCPPGTCDPTAGTPVAVELGTTTSGIDFVLTPEVEPTCVPSPTVLCLNDDRFSVEVQWRDFSGQTDAGRGVELTGDTGYFWFFEPLNVELVIKVLDGCFDPFNTFWVFAGGLTDVEVDLTVTDTVTGEVRAYSNALGSAFAPIQDLDAFATCPAAGQAAAEDPVAAASVEMERLLAELDADAPVGLVPRAAEPAEVKSPGACVADAKTLCLSDGRFAVTALWDTGAQIGDGRAVQLTADTGYFWFFSPANVEAVVKVLNACNLQPFNNFWVFAAGLTDVGVILRVIDTETFEVQHWVNPLGRTFQPIRETDAFRTCP